MKARNMRCVVALALACLAAAMAGCASTRASASMALTPRWLDEVRHSAPEPAATGTRRPTVALVLGGGGLRGFAHLGVLRALEEAGIRPDIVVGTSAGAVVGAAYASGLTASQIESIAREVKLSSLIDLSFSSGGIMRGNHLAHWIDTVTAGVPIEAFPIRFGAVATDLRSEQPVLLDQGSAGRAIQASAAVPGVQVPVPYGEGHLIDGGITSLVPVRFARAMGADFVIAVDIYCKGSRSRGLGAPAVIRRVMQAQSCLVAAPEMAQADVLISPAVSVSGMSARGEQDGAIEAGYEAARAALKGMGATHTIAALGQR
ncbi:patatin-like phospholipase family protein [Variovorax sp. J22R133]|uniref:patatin-like phospholipase family protein n=1 Tax=Variovorax brevis TaxID=3053503 RepID=UPI002577F9CB|nr:patatin-like phospholipase family protein [Variovorax sp. J22R133]MDM0117054.1 patatin-like phospholipase family protein [Variovorax sp. J22R133]